MTDRSADISTLQRAFGGNIDKDVLLAVLEVCNGDVKEAQKYLQASDNNSGYDARQLSSMEGGIPKNYPGQGTNTVSARNRVFPDQAKTASTDPAVASISPEDAMKALFLAENKSFQEHYDAQKNNYEMYVSVLLLLLSSGVEISKACRPRILAAAWARQDHKLPKYLLDQEELIGLPHLLGAINLLDAGRKIRCIEKKIARLEKQGARARKITTLKNSINDLQREAQIGSVSGALAKHVKKWVQNVPAYKLEFYALNMPKGPWCELADLIHLAPKDFQCKWFLEYSFGKDAPQDSIIEACKTLSAETVVDILTKHSVPYSYLRLQVKQIPDSAKVKIAQYIPLDTLIWYYEELSCPEVDTILEARLQKEKPTLNYGKLMERCLYFKSLNAPFYKYLIPVAEEKLSQLDLQLESPVVVIGDASYSMDVAIRVSTVIASVLTVLCGADLKFFTGESVDPPFIPQTAAEVIDVATKVRADGLTAPAAALWPYYEKKKVVKFFVVVTDEVENEQYKGYYFPTLFQKYYNEVYPAKIVFVSFLENPTEKGRMVKALESMGIIPLQFILEGKRPDLTKLDSLLGLLASESTFFPSQAKEMSSIIKEAGIEGALQKILAPKVRPVSTASTSKKEDNNNNVEKKPIEKEESKKPIGENAVSSEVQKEETQSKECVICEEAKAVMALVECGHLNFCEKCAGPLKECPICRSPVLKAVRIYQ